MNERIEEFAEQAKEYSKGWFGQDKYRTTEDMFNAKFAELIIDDIINECGVYEIEMWTKYKNGDLDRDERGNTLLMSKSDAAAELAEIISKRFGV